MEAFVTAGAGFLLAVLWFDLMFDVQAHGATVASDAVGSISTYYRRVTTDASPMNNLVAAAMLATLIAIIVELATGEVAAWVGWGSLGLALPPMVTAALRTVPRAVRLGTASDPVDEQTRMAQRILREHVFCFTSIAALIAVQLISAT
jgi:hypothetical protein